MDEVRMVLVGARVIIIEIVVVVVLVLTWQLHNKPGSDTGINSVRGNLYRS